MDGVLTKVMGKGPWVGYKLGVWVGTNGWVQRHGKGGCHGWGIY